MIRLHKSAALLAAASLLLNGCVYMGFKSLPWATSTKLYNTAAVDFLRHAPAVSEQLGEGLVAKDIDADGVIVGLSVSGGGARATAFTLGVLAGLREIEFGGDTNALEAVDFISSNSGGSWAVSAYLIDRTRSAALHYDPARRMAFLRDGFVQVARGRGRCWNRAMRQDGALGKATFGDVYQGTIGRQLPRAYFNSSLLPAHAPFVFTDAFLTHYKVGSLGACRDEAPLRVSKLANVPLSFAAAASGSVPGYYAAYATTSLCNPDGAGLSFCFADRKGKPLTDLRLADGGLYDNIGYKSAWEVMRSLQGHKVRKRAMVLVNSGTDIDPKTIAPGSRYSNFLATTATTGVFGVQDSSFERLYAQIFASVGVDDPVLLDFYSTARFRPEMAIHLRGLDALAFYAAHNVSCFVGTKVVRGENRKVPAEFPSVAESLDHLAAKGGDCLSENFYRTGTLSKTSYRFDRELFDVISQLGILSVRMNADRIRQAVQ